MNNKPIDLNLTKAAGQRIIQKQEAEIRKNSKSKITFHHMDLPETASARSAELAPNDFHIALDTNYFNIRTTLLTRNQPLETNDFMGALTALHHENEHVNQLAAYHTQTDTRTYTALISYIACKNNSDYYKKNHGLMAHELYADKAAIRQTHEALYSIFPQNDTRYKNLDREQLLVDYVNKMTSQDTPQTQQYTIRRTNGKPFENITEIVKAFADAEQEVTRKTKPYTSQRSDDDFARILQFKNPSDQWKPFVTAFKNARTGLQQDLMMACVNYYIHPEYAQQHEILKNVDLSPERIFGQQFPETPSQISQRLQTQNNSTAKPEQIKQTKHDAKPTMPPGRNFDDPEYRALAENTAKANAENPNRAIDY